MVPLYTCMECRGPAVYVYRVPWSRCIRIWSAMAAHARKQWHPATPHFIRTSIYDKHSGSMKITTHLDHISQNSIWYKLVEYHPGVIRSFESTTHLQQDKVT